MAESFIKQWGRLVRGKWPSRRDQVAKVRKKSERANVNAWFVYILRCSDGSLYTGITTNMERRVEQHNAGTAPRYTRSRRPVRVAYRETHVSRSLASKREWAVKAMRRSEKESVIRQGGSGQIGEEVATAERCVEIAVNGPSLGRGGSLIRVYGRG